ncbi:MAG: hypothetical protein P1Q69_17870, partial [Candidatus Thorarchaeota archaeon]|nr:hypothetical protein [Candidatus Thorarchaeota archaeon]
SSPNGTAVTISYGQSYRYVMLFENTSGYGLPGANVSIVNMNPGTGLSNGSLVDEDNGFYSVILTPDQVGVFTVLFEAKMINHETQFISFTLSSTVIGTLLTVEASADLVAVGDPLYITLNYTTEFGAGIEGANISIVTPPPGLSVPPTPIELGGGLYKYTITAAAGGAYQLRFRANATKHLDATAAYSFLVGLYASVLTSLNGTTGSIGFNHQFTLVLEYTNSTGYGLSGAVAGITSIVPSIGLNVDDVVDNGDGTYSILLTPTISGIFTIQIEVVKVQYENQVISFTITSPVIATLLALVASSEIVAIGDDCIITFTYTNETSDGIVGGTITVLSRPSGLVFTDVEELGNGIYRINISTTEVDEYQLRFRASALNHLNATAAITLSVTLVPSRLEIETQLPEYSAFFGESLELHINYLELNYLGVALSNISDAIIEVTATDNEGLNTAISFVDGCYIIFLSGDNVGLWEIMISASKEGHSSDDIYIDFRVYPVETTVSEVESLLCYYGRSYNVTYNFLFANNSSGIEGATPIKSGRGSDWIIITEIGSGVYKVSFTPIDIGTYSVILDFVKEGYQTQASTLSFEVDEIPLEIVTDRTLIWNQLDALTLNLVLSVADTQEPVTDAQVIATLFSNGVYIDEWPLTHSGSGVYNKTIPETIWSSSEDLFIKISVSKPNHHIDSLSIDISSIPASFSEILVRQYGPPLALFTLIFIASAISIVSIRRRHTKLRIRALEIKSRFDDANNLLGILILHKNSGLPFYSKILKGGFEEGMLSAFVTAVTHFRSEFDQNGTEADREWKLTPISDIIRAGPTRNLICAFVTLTSPSLAQEARMLAFTREIGMLLDDEMEVPPTEFRDDKTGQIIEDLFNLHVDGFLLQDYRIPMSGALPRKFKDITNACAIAGLGDVFTLTELSRGLKACGMDDTSGYNFIFKAIDEGLIWPINKLDELE